MRRTLLFALLFSVCFGYQSIAQVAELERIGQTPGGAGFTVNWDSLGQKLIVGCGTSIWIYDMADPDHAVCIAKRPFMGIVNETELYDSVLFAAATHDGIYALNYNSPNLEVLAHYDMHNIGDTAAYDMWRSNDTLYVADKNKIQIFKYTPGIGSGFQKIGFFGPPNAYCVARRGDYIVAGGQGYLYLTPLPAIMGMVSIYHKNNLTTPVASWKSEKITVIQDLQFADLNDSIIYVCGGPEDFLFQTSNFFALQFTGDSLFPIDTFVVSGGIAFLAQVNIINMDSRNDTLYLATTAAWDGGLPLMTYMPIIDATGLPDDTMRQIAYVHPGFWHFDVALMDGTPDLAMSSEWFGFLISDISQLLPFDTIGLYPTGGWCVNNKVKHGYLWACHEGYGLVAYDIDSLLYVNGFDNQAERMQIYDLGNHYFSSDLEFLNDTLLMINSSEVYNIAGWLAGGQEQLMFDMGKNFIIRMSSVQTNLGQRMVATHDDNWNHKWITLFDPFDAGNNYQTLAIDSMHSDPGGMTVSGDTVYYGQSYGNIRYLCARKVVDDDLVFLDTIRLSMGFSLPPFDHEVHSISVEDGTIAVAYGQQFAWFRWNGSELEEVHMEYDPARFAFGIVLRNRYAYVSDKFYGLKVYDISSLSSATLVARCAGTGGWNNLYGNLAISVADDGKIYMSDFQAGVILIEAFDTTTSSINKPIFLSPRNFSARVFPNPATNWVNVEITTSVETEISSSIHSLGGHQIDDLSIIRCLPGTNTEKLKLRHLPQGFYIIEFRNESGEQVELLNISR